MSGSGPDGDRPGTEALFPLVYEELKRLAHQHRRDAGAGATLRTTEIVHEAYLKLAGPAGVSWQGRAHFFGAASRAMRQVLVDVARKHRAAKRGAGAEMVSLSQADTAIELELEEILSLHQALDKLDHVSPRLRLLVELRFFGGLHDDEIARMLEVSTRTVARDWLKAKLFLLDELRPSEVQLR